MCKSYGESRNDLLLLNMGANIFNRPNNGCQQPFKFAVIVRLN